VFAGRCVPDRPDPDARPSPAATGQVSGTFRDPHGDLGTFVGGYRLERLVDQFGQLAAAGVFTGNLTDSSGDHLGFASRRLTAAAEVVPTPSGSELRIGPLDVNLLGLFVRVEHVAVPVKEEPAASTDEDTSNVVVLPVASRSRRARVARRGKHADR
jgi:hypothetical protein